MQRRVGVPNGAAGVKASWDEGMIEGSGRAWCLRGVVSGCESGGAWTVCASAWRDGGTCDVERSDMVQLLRCHVWGQFGILKRPRDTNL